MKLLGGLISVAAIVAPTFALAADPAPREGMDWSGIFIGASAGLFSANSNARPGDGTDNVTNTGGIAGVQGGYRHQFQNGFVLGGEIYMPVASSGGNYTQTFPFPPPNSVVSRARVNWAVDTSLIAGYAIGDFLPFATAGFVVAGGEVETNSFGLTGSRKQTHTGFSLGAGLEYALDDNWSVRGQYKFTRVGREDYAIRPGVVGKVGMDIHMGLFGVNYRF